MEFSVNPKIVSKLMLGIIFILLSLHIAQLVIYYYVDDADVFDFVKLLDFDYEANLPSLYSSLAIIFCAILLWTIGLDKKRNRTTFRFHWLGLAVIFTFLGVDEAVALHEELGDFVEELELFEATGYLYFAWVVPYGIFLAIFFISYLKFVLSLPRSIMIQFVIAGVLFILGAVGLEVLSAHEADLNGTETILYSVLYTIEELLEMSSMVLFSHALLKYIANENGSITFKVTTD